MLGRCWGVAWALLLGNPGPFAFKYTLGNLLSIGSASFLVGPARQCKTMLAPQRRTASLVYIGTLVGTLVSVFAFRLALLSLLFVVLQFLALTWYVLSYVPYGQAAAKRILRKLAKTAGIDMPSLLSAEPSASSTHSSAAIGPAAEGAAAASV